MYSVPKVNVRKCQYAPPIHIIITSIVYCYIFHISIIIIYHAKIVLKKIKNFIISINRLTRIYKKILFTKFISNCQCVANIKKRPSPPKSTVNKTCDISKLDLKYFERQEKPILIL